MFKFKHLNIIFENDIDLKNKIINILNLFDDETLIVKIFSKDEYNSFLQSISDKNITNSNYTYYLLHDVTFLDTICFSQVKFITIAICPQKNLRFDSPVLFENTKGSPIKICLDNYLEYTKIHINKNYCDEATLNKIKQIVRI